MRLLHLRRAGSFKPLLLCVSLALGLVAAWVLRLGFELGVDESGTYWVIQGGIDEAIGRAIRLQGQSPLYFVLEWGAARVLGVAEWELRVPSVILLLVGMWLLYLLGKSWFDPQAGAIAALVLGCESAQYALEARPYALGLLAVIGAWLCLSRWVEHGRARDAIGYAAFAVLEFYAHFIFAVLSVLHACFVFHAWRSGRRVSLPIVVCVASAIIALTWPGVPQLSTLFARREALSYAQTPGQPELAAGLVPTILISAALVAGALAWMSRTKPVFQPARGWPHAAWALVWGIFPVLLLFGLARLGTVQLYVPRYYSCGAPGIALFAAWCVRGLSPEGIRAAVLAVFVALHVAQPVTAANPTRWREVSAGVRRVIGDDAVPVLLPPVFVEARQVDWVKDREKRAYLLALADYYEVPGGLIPVPHRLSDESTLHLREVIERQLRDAKRFMWIARAESTALEAWLDGQLAQLPFRRSSVRAGGMFVHRYDRVGAPSHR